jgi:hypothetical protein
MAASLALPALDAERAAQLAEAEGLVTHLTSLVLVDEAGEAEQGIPANRKIALAPPATASMDVAAFIPTARLAKFTDFFAGDASFSGKTPSRFLARRFARSSANSLRRIGINIDWDRAPNQLMAGDLTGLDPSDVPMLKHAAKLPEVLALAEQLKIDPVVLVVALLARSQSPGNRSATRIAKAILGNGNNEDVCRIAQLLGLS